MAENQKKVKIGTTSHKDRRVIFFSFDYDNSLVKRLKTKFPNARWSQSNKFWYIPDTAATRKMLYIAEKTPHKNVFLKISPENQFALNKFVETLQLKAYSPNTIKTYTNEFSQLLQALKNTRVDGLSYNRLRSYFLYCTNELKLSENLLHSRINAVKFYFEQVLKKEKFFMEIPRPKKPSTLPKVLNSNDIKKLFTVTTNEKHLLMLELCYGMGLRVSEIVNIKISDIDSKRMKVLIEGAKGKKDRYVNLPETILPLLKIYYKEVSPRYYLFEGINGSQYAIRSVQAVFKNAMKKAKIKKPVGIHSLRHSYATHLMEHGTDIQFIQKLMGHKDLKTTLVYTHVSDKNISNIKSPLDFL